MLYSGKTVALGWLHSLGRGKSWSSGTVNRWGWRLPGCSACPGLLSVTSMLWCTPRHLLTPSSRPFKSTGDLLRSLRRELVFTCYWADRPRPHSGGFETHRLPSTWFRRPAKAVARGVAAVACLQLWEPQVRAEWQVTISGRRAILKRTWQAPLPKVLPLPDPPKKESLKYNEKKNIYIDLFLNYSISFFKETSLLILVLFH